ERWGGRPELRVPRREHGPPHEACERQHHRRRPRPEVEERARSAAAAELHPDGEDERTDQHREARRGDGAAEGQAEGLSRREERREEHGGDGQHQHLRPDAAAVAAGDEGAEGRGETTGRVVEDHAEGSAGGWWRVTITCYPRWSLARSRFPRWVRSGPRSGTGGDTDDELLARRGDDLDPGYGPEGGGGPARSGRDGDAPRAGRAPGLDGPDDPDAARARRRLRPAQPDLGPDPRARARRDRPTAVADPGAPGLLGRLRDRRHDGYRGDGRAGNGGSDGDPHPVHSAPGDRRAHPGRGMAGR